MLMVGQERAYVDEGFADEISAEVVFIFKHNSDKTCFSISRRQIFSILLQFHFNIKIYCFFEIYFLPSILDDFALHFEDGFVILGETIFFPSWVKISLGLLEIMQCK